MADEKSMTIRRELFERVYKIHQESPSIVLSLMNDHTEEDFPATIREAQWLLDKGWIEGKAWAHGANLKLTSRGRDYYEDGGWWAPKSAPHVLSDREAARRRGEQAVAEAYKQISSAMMTGRSQPMMALHRALPEAVRFLSSKLIELYAQVPEATEKAVRDELVETIQKRVSAFIQSCHAMHGRGSNAAVVARLTARVHSDALLPIPHEFDLAVYDRVKKAGDSRTLLPAAPARIKQRKFGILDEAKDHYESDFKAGVGALGVSVIYFDLDKFADLNSKFSEPVVDEVVLPALQEAIRSLVDHRGFAYAEGGDEFIVVLPNTNTALAEAFTKELLDQIRSLEFLLEGESRRVTASAGIASSTAPDDWQECRIAAAKAKKAAKDAGRDRYEVSARRV